MKLKLTRREKALLAVIPPRGDWLHEIAECSHETAGVLGSLVKKGLATSEELSKGVVWVKLVIRGATRAMFGRTYPSRSTLTTRVFPLL